MSPFFVSLGDELICANAYAVINGESAGRVHIHLCRLGVCCKHEWRNGGKGRGGKLVGIVRATLNLVISFP